MYLVNGQERSLIKSSFSVSWLKGNSILPFAVWCKRHAEPLMKDLLLCVHVVLKTLNFEISRCHLTDYVKELY